MQIKWFADAKFYQKSGDWHLLRKLWLKPCKQDGNWSLSIKGRFKMVATQKMEYTLRT